MFHRELRPEYSILMGSINWDEMFHRAGEKNIAIKWYSNAVFLGILFSENGQFDNHINSKIKKDHQ